MPSRESTILESQIATVDEKTAQASKIFQSIDRNKDGSISEDEFTRAFDILQRVVRQNHDEIDRGKRRARFLCHMLVFCGLLLVINFAGNMALMYMLLQMTKDVKLERPSELNSEQGSIMTNRNGDPVATASTTRIFDDISELPLLGPTFDYISISRLQLPEIEFIPAYNVNQTVMHGYRVEGYRWYTLTDMDLELSMDTTLQITANGVQRVKTSKLIQALETSATSSRRHLASTSSVQSVPVQSASGNVMMQDTSSTTSGSRVCPATLGDINNNRNCYNVVNKECVTCGGQPSAASQGSSGTTLSNGVTAGSRLCPATMDDYNKGKTCYDLFARKCIVCRNRDATNLIGDPTSTGGSRVCPGTQADITNNRNCYNVWEKKCVVCSGSFKGITNGKTGSN
jgi:hypothetical protein